MPCSAALAVASNKIVKNLTGRDTVRPSWAEKSGFIKCTFQKNRSSLLFCSFLNPVSRNLCWGIRQLDASTWEYKHETSKELYNTPPNPNSKYLFQVMILMPSYNSRTSADQPREAGLFLHVIYSLTVSLQVIIATERGRVLKNKNSIYMLLSVSVVLWEIFFIYLFIYNLKSVWCQHAFSKGNAFFFWFFKCIYMHTQMHVYTAIQTYLYI